MGPSRSSAFLTTKLRVGWGAPMGVFWVPDEQTRPRLLTRCEDGKGWTMMEAVMKEAAGDAVTVEDLQAELGRPM